ncbi:MAG: tyrosine--tRNA ligase [bacterium]|nr:tyrosine--tRNA ligase [bacterium]
MKDKLEDKVKNLLTKGVEEVILKKHLEEKLKSGAKLRVKFGIDPTSPDFHLGHSVSLLKLKQFQDLGHQVILLVGDFTAMIGDPSGRANARKPLTKAEVQKNMADYIQQAAKILDIKKVEIRYNSEWYAKKGMDFVVKITSRFTYAQLIEREEFQRRIEAKADISLLELIYPLLQGYDSVELKADVEIGGTDQKFNLLMGRKVQQKFNQPEQDIITVPLLEGIDGIKKMSKSSDNYIGLTEDPFKMFGKIMSIPDKIMSRYFELLTDVSQEEIASLNPRDQKLRLAREIVKFYHGDKTAGQAQEEFIKVFREGEPPSQIKTIKITPCSIGAKELLVKCDLAKSLSDAQRLIEQGAVSLDGQTVKDWRQKISINKPSILKAGKHHFIKLTP